MSQQTELDPLSPSLRDLLGAWWRPWRALLKFGGIFGVRLAPVAVMGFFVWDFFKSAPKMVEGGGDPAFLQVTEAAATTMFGVFESIPTVVLLLLFPAVILQFLRMLEL